MNPEIILQKSVLTNGQVRLDLVIQNQPQNLLGIAFDLKIDGADYDHFELAQNLKEGKTAPPIFLAKQEGDSIVFGFTAKVSDKLLLENGLVGSFFLKSDPTQISIDKLIVSVYEKGRKDLNDVKWQLKNVTETDLSALKESALTTSNQKALTDSTNGVIEQSLNAGSDPAEMAETNLDQQTLADLLNAPTAAATDWSWIWWGIGALILVGILSYFLSRKFGLIKKRTRIRLLKDLVE